MHNNLKRTELFLAVANCFVFCTAHPAFADNPRLEEVIVTAQKQEENMQSVPLAISAMTGEDLAKKGITNFEGVAKSTPSISFTTYQASTNTLVLFMRGVGAIDPGQITSDSAVGLYEDGFYIARAQAVTFDLADVERVEVLRGPQGVLYGRNTTGGAVNLISKQPTGVFGFKQNFTFGSRNQFRSLTTVDLPAVGDVAGKVTFLKSSIDGYVKNTGSSHDFGEQEQQAGRVLLHWDIAPNLTVDYFAEMGDVNDTPIYFQVPAFNGQALFPGVPYYAKTDGLMDKSYRAVDLDLSTSDFEAHGLTVSWDVNDYLTIKSLTGYRELDADVRTDYAEALGFYFRGRSVYHDYQFSQEFQFSGQLLDGNLNYVSGVYYFEEAGFRSVTGTFPAFNFTTYRAVNADSTSFAAFGQLTWTPDLFDQNLDLVFGGRFTKDKREAVRNTATNGVAAERGKATGSANDQSFSRFNPAFTINYRWNEDISTYAKVATGYKAGGSLDSAPAGRFSQTFDPEELTNYELGMKSYWLDHRVRANMAAFSSKYEDMQLQIAGAPGNPTVTQAYNAGRATIKGFELELVVVPTDDLTLRLDYTRLITNMDKVDAIAGTNFDKTINPSSPYNAGDNVRRLFVVPYAPEHSFTLSGDYTFFHFAGGDLSLHLDYRWQDKIYISPTLGPDVPGRDFAAIPAYGLVDGRVTMAMDLPRGDQVKVSLWGKNLFDKEYYKSLTSPGAGPVAVGSTPAGVTSRGPAWSEPPSYGVDISYQY